MNAIAPSTAIKLLLMAFIVNFGLINSSISKIECPAKTPIPKPNTLTKLNNGTYPAKSSRPKIKGMVKLVRANSLKVKFSLNQNANQVWFYPGPEQKPC